MNLTEQKIQDAIDHLEGTLHEMYHEMEAEKTRRFESAHEDKDLENIVFVELDKDKEYFDSEECTEEDRDAYEKLYNEYYKNLSEYLDSIVDFSDAEDSSYLCENEEFEKMAKEGAKMEKILEKLKAVLEEEI